ncbi:MAG: DUF2130 domain-containing protein [Flavipsychrobacter sp.]
MNTSIICPNCNTSFEPTDAIAQSVREQVQQEFRVKWVEAQKKKEEEFKEREMQIQQQLRKNIAEEFDGQLKYFQKLLSERDEKLKAASSKEMELLELKDKLMAQEKEMELQLKRAIIEERAKLQESLRKDEEERQRLRDQEYQMKVKELEKQLEDQRKLAEEMKRKAEQGSMQLQGEVQELALEALLRNTFPFDVVSEVGKGVRGADCIQTVRNNFGQECGKIIYESKRTKDFSLEWIEKLKSDMRSLGADVAIIVTQSMPKDMDCFGEKDGVWICNFGEVRALANVMRDLVIKIYTATKNQDNKGDKMTLLYNYLISHEFSGQWRAIREGFMAMKISIQKERDQMEKLWKAREKQLEKVLLNAAHIKGSIEGIAGMESVDLNLISDDQNYLID